MLALLVATSLRVSPAAGFGIAYGFGGVHLEVSYGHFGAFAGIGFIDFSDPFGGDVSAVVAPAAGLRLYSGDGDGLFLSLHGAYFHDGHIFDDGSEFTAQDRFVVAATVGVRLEVARVARDTEPALVWVELAAGPAWSRVHQWGNNFTGFPFDSWKTHFGTMESTPLPDLSLALGASF